MAEIIISWIKYFVFFYCIGDNKIKLDGYSTIATSDWKELNQILVNWSQDDKFDPIFALSMLVSNWSKKLIVKFSLDSKF